LFRIMLNAVRARGRKSPLSMVPMEGREFPADSRMQEAVEISQALDELGVEQRTVVLLGVVEGFTCREMAEILEVPMGTVMSRLARAREALRKRLTPKYSIKEA